jgi:uncharacterized protein YbbC (DUF1343 family)/peptidoglycan/xylan/chitin deacetylase (PgdA/CDA1 family)
MRKSLAVLLTALVFLLNAPNSLAQEKQESFKLGDDLLLSDYHQLIDGKKVGLVTNQSGVNSQGKSIEQILADYPRATLKALFAPEHGLDGKAKAGDYVESYTDKKLNIPVYSLYGDTRMPTKDMLDGIDVLVFDIQDIGARSYTYISTLNYCLVAAQKYNKQVVVLDRPNPLGGQLVDGPVLEDKYKSFVGIDNLPMAHGMTVGELAQFFNRKIGADLKVVPMQGYNRDMLFTDTGLSWVPTSPYIPTVEAAMEYMATGLREGTGIVQEDYFKWIGGVGVHSQQFADLMNQAHLPGVQFTPADHGDAGGALLTILDPHQFNPVRTGIYALATAHQLNSFEVPTSKDNQITMFDKIMGTGSIGESLIQGKTPEEMEKSYKETVEKFKEDRKPYLLYASKDERVLTQQPEPQKLQEIKKSSLDGGIYRHDKGYIPFSSVFSQLGYKVTWHSDTRLITAENAHWNIVIDPNVSLAKVTVNDQAMGAEIDPFIRNGITYIPAFFITYLESSASVERGDTIRILTADQQIDVSYQIERDPPKVPVLKGKIAYLTFDDGPSKLTPQILDILKDNDVKATFFIVGQNVKGHEGVLQRELEDGHAIGNHTFSHDYNSIYRNENAFFQDLNSGADAIDQVIGMKPTIIRFPGGSNNQVSKHAEDPQIYGRDNWVMEDLVKEVKDRGYNYFDWNVSTGDAESNSYSVNSAVDHVKEGIGNGSKKEVIVLAHDAGSKLNTVLALPRIIQLLKDEGYSFGTLDVDTPAIAFLK